MNNTNTEEEFLSLIDKKSPREIHLKSKHIEKAKVEFNGYDQLPEYALKVSPTKSESNLTMPSNEDTVELFCNEDGNEFKTLHRAVWKGKKKNVLKYLSKKDKLKKINKQDAHGRCALHFAAASGKVEILNMLLTVDGVEKELRDKKGMTPFYKAAQLGSIPCMKELQDHGACINSTDIGGNSPIHHIILGGDNKLDAVQHLLSINKSFVHTKNDLGMTPLHLASSYRRREIGRFLIENGALVDEKNNKGLTALMMSARKDDKVMVGHLLQNGANVSIPDNEQKTAVDHAVKDSMVLSMLSNNMKRNPADASCSSDDTIEIMKERDESITKTEQLRVANKKLEEEIQRLREVRKKQKRRNVLNGIRKKSLRVLKKHKIRELTSEVEQEKEMKILKEKIKELENVYEELMKHYDNICEEDVDVRKRFTIAQEIKKKLEGDITIVKQGLSSTEEDFKMISFEIKEAENELKRKVEAVTEIKIAIDKCEQEIESAKENHTREVNELKIKIEETGQVLQKFVVIDDLKQELKTAEQNEIETTKKVDNIKLCFKKLNKKYKALKEKYVSGDENSQ